MLRTNYFHTGPSEHAPHLSFKLDPSELRWLPQPRPHFEIFVYSPRTEGVHLRGGPVARGGIRWSDRREDFRTEVLGLMKAQMVKNAVIVPVGAKGGFVVKQPPARRDDLPEEVVACYQTFIRGLLDLTDNIEGGEVVPHPGIVRYDGDDPYLVVAADKGTATFSDIANGIALRGGLLARRRVRLRRLDRLRPQEDGHHRPRCLGVREATLPRAGPRHPVRGLHGRRRRRHVGRRVRERDAALAPHQAPRRVQPPAHLHRPRSGPGAELRGARATVRAAAARPGPTTSRRRSRPAAACTSAPRSRSRSRRRRARRSGSRSEALKPNELIQALLRAPVDLLWNGGIGTYVKASDGDARRRRRQGQRRGAGERLASCAPRWSARAATSA